MDNNQRFFNPGGGTSAQVEGRDYLTDDDGFISVDNPDHYDMLRRMGWLRAGEQAPPLVTVADPAGKVCDRWPLLTTAMAADDLDLTVARTPDDVLGLIEGRLLDRARRAAAEQGISLEEFLERHAPKREEVVLNQPEPDPQPELNLPTPESELVPFEKPPSNYTGPVARVETPAVELEAPADPAPVAPAVDETAEQTTEAATETETETSTEAATVPDPAFNKLNRAEIVDWLMANGGATYPDGTEAKGTDAKDDLIAAGEARLTALNNPAPAE